MTNAPTPSTTRESPTHGGSGEQAKAEARKVAESGKRGAGQVADEARSQAAELARTAREDARHRVDGEVGKLAAFLDDIGGELGAMADGAGRTDGHLPALARDGAQIANRWSQRLETGGLDGALHDVSMFARRRPGVFLATAFGVGLALGRVTRNADLRSIGEEIKGAGDSDEASTPQYRRPTMAEPLSTSNPSTRTMPTAQSTTSSGRTR